MIMRCTPIMMMMVIRRHCIRFRLIRHCARRRWRISRFVMEENATRTKEALIPFCNHRRKSLLLLWITLHGLSRSFTAVDVSHREKITDKCMPICIVKIPGSIAIRWLGKGKIVSGGVWHQIQIVSEDGVRTLDLAWPFLKVECCRGERWLSGYIISADISATNACLNRRIWGVRIGIGRRRSRVGVVRCVWWWSLFVHLAWWE